MTKQGIEVLFLFSRAALSHSNIFFDREIIIVTHTTTLHTHTHREKKPSEYYLIVTN